MLKSSARPYVCWRCITYSRNGLHPVNQTTASRIGSRQWRLVSTQHQAAQDNSFGQGHIPASVPKGRPELDRRPIRERLREWVPESDLVQPVVVDWGISSKLANNNTRPQSSGSSELDNFKSDPEGMGEMADETSAEDSVVGSGVRNPGDLVEINQPGYRIPTFCVFLGYFGDRNHFYSSTGKWMMSLGYSSIFTVSNFATPDELKTILDMIPKNGTSDDYEELRLSDRGPPRSVAKHLIKKMNKFMLDADTVYQGSLTNLDSARPLLSDSRRTKYLSLFEIADVLLPQALRSNDTFPPHALYAVHKALYRNDFVFRPVSPLADCHRRDHLFEIFPFSDTLLINRVAALVREYTLVMGQQGRSFTPNELKGSALGNFILKARDLVRASRERRAWTPYGILTPSNEFAFWEEPAESTRSTKDIIRYLEWWASYDLFEDASRFHSYGALILRALDLYPDASLDQSTAWTFLQEIGVIPPWEIPSRYKVRFPGVRIRSGGGYTREVPMQIEDSLRPDIAEGNRKTWDTDNVFCIDSPSTMIIDDGVSLESTEKPDEFWIHIHTADPASGIQPNSELCNYMELIPENIYLPGHFQAMLPSDMGSETTNDYKSEGLTQRYSLAPNRPTLTFSAKVNEAGDLLDYKVEPGVLKNVAYLDPSDVAEFCNEPPNPSLSEDSLRVGTLEGRVQPPNREMLATKDLSESGKAELQTLYRLSEAIKQKRLERGAWPLFFPRPSVSISFPDLSVLKENLPKGVKTLSPDPSIEVGYKYSSSSSVVSNTMVLAGEIAARWCSDRGIPLPYRKDVHSDTHYDETLKYATKVLYPLVKQGIQPSIAQRQEFGRLTGGIEMSSTPGPYFILGLDMYAKATSPLRRFSDLIVHWQIHAALAEERILQRPISKEDNLDAVLPFPAHRLTKTLSMLQMREKMARAVSFGVKDWILIALVRAWRFEDSAPKTMRFTVNSRWRQGLMGRVDFFDLDVTMDVANIAGTVLIKDVRVGDQFDVELADVNVHSRQVFVKALRYLGHGRSAVDQSGEPA